MPTIQAFALRFKDVADFCFVYLSEAHASDVWPLGAKVIINNHTTIEDRIAAAARIGTDWNINGVPVFVDTMNDTFDKNFFAWPERFYIIEGSDARFAHIAMPSLQDRGFDRKEIEAVLSAIAPRPRTE